MILCMLLGRTRFPEKNRQIYVVDLTKYFIFHFSTLCNAQRCTFYNRGRGFHFARLKALKKHTSPARFSARLCLGVRWECVQKNVSQIWSPTRLLEFFGSFTLSQGKFKYGMKILKAQRRRKYSLEPSSFRFGLRFSGHTPIVRQGKDARKTRAGVVCSLSAFKRAFWSLWGL